MVEIYVNVCCPVRKKLYTQETHMNKSKSSYINNFELLRFWPPRLREATLKTNR